MTFQALLDRAAGASTCQFLNQFGSGLIGYGAYALFAGGPVVAPLAIGSAALLAMNAGCSWDSDAAPTVNDPGPIGDMCWETDGSFNISRIKDGAFVGTFIYNVRRIISSSFLSYNSSTGTTTYEVTYIDSQDGTQKVGSYYTGAGNTIRQDFDSGTCTTQGPGSSPVPDPVDYTDPDTGCNLTVHWEGVAVDSTNTPYPVYRIEPSATLLRTGGIIGGCNFAPVIYVPPGGGGGGGGGTYIPYEGPYPPDPDGKPWWLPLAEAALGGLIGAAAKKILDELTAESVAGKVYRLTSVCETNAAGEPVDLVREVDIPPLSILQGAIYRLDAIEYLLQGLKDFRQPTCLGSSASGQLVSVDFTSDEPSPGGTRPLRKLLRYRDQTDSPLSDHVAHWESFVWQAGPVIVKHINGPWGQVQVWASDADEAKRVIRHAGTIAGVDPDAVGEWRVTSSRDPRYGQPGTMRAATRKSWGGQILQISKRSGPDGLPIVPCDCV